MPEKTTTGPPELSLTSIWPASRAWTTWLPPAKLVNVEVEPEPLVEVQEVGDDRVEVAG